MVFPCSAKSCTDCTALLLLVYIFTVPINSEAEDTLPLLAMEENLVIILR